MFNAVYKENTDKQFQCAFPTKNCYDYLAVKIYEVTSWHQARADPRFMRAMMSNYPVDTGRKLNVHKTFNLFTSCVYRVR